MLKLISIVRWENFTNIETKLISRVKLKKCNIFIKILHVFTTFFEKKRGFLISAWFFFSARDKNFLGLNFFGGLNIAQEIFAYKKPTNVFFLGVLASAQEKLSNFFLGPKTKPCISGKTLKN
jgi:hypothetical protein